MPYRPHLVSSTTRPLVRPLVQKVFGDFDPLRLDPYLLFDAATSMVGTLENPTLDLDPSKPDTLNVITATRAGTATLTDVNGNIASAPANTVRVDYTQGAELTPTKFQRVNYTDFSQGWTASNTTVISGDGFGGHASQKITAGSSGNKLFTGDVSGVSSGTPYTISFYVKRLVGSGRVDLIHNNITGTPISQDFTITSDFTRVTAQFNGATSGTTATNIQFRLFTAGDQIEISQPQFEEGTTATDFVENTTGSPKFITGATFGPRVPMILVEPSATNLVTYSEDFSHSSWTKTAATMEGGHTAPDGTETAYKLIEDNTNSVHRTFQTATASVSPSASISVFVKYSGRRYVLIRFADQSVGRWYDLISGTLGGTYLGTPNDSSIELIGNDWYRITLSHTSDAQARCEFWVSDTESVNSYTGDGTSGVYIWGAQLETGIATSYIPTSGSTAQRAKDDLVISGSAFSDFFNASEGTIYLETIINPFSHPSGDYLWSINDGGYENRIVSVYDTRLYNYVISSNAINFVNPTNLPSLDGIMRSALSYKTNNVIDSLNGVTSTPDTSVTLPSGLNKLNIGQDNASGSTMTGRFRRLIYWPYHSDSL